MPRGKQVAVEAKAKAKPKKVTIKRAKQEPKINQAEIDRIKSLLDQEEKVLEEDMKVELSKMIDDRDLRMSRELNKIDTKNKKMIMWIGVTLFMLSIVSFWVSSLDVTIRQPYLKSGTQVDQKSLAEYKENLDKTFKEVMIEIDQLKEQSKKLEAAQSSTTTSTSEINKFKSPK